MDRHVKIEIHGKVQGVWFRHFTRKEAVRLGISGFVMNRSDGSVYIEASGPGDKVSSLETWCHTGSPLSRVDRVVVTETDQVHTEDFYIKS